MLRVRVRVLRVRVRVHVCACACVRMCVRVRAIKQANPMTLLVPSTSRTRTTTPTLDTRMHAVLTCGVLRDFICMLSHHPPKGMECVHALVFVCVVELGEVAT